MSNRRIERRKLALKEKLLFRRKQTGHMRMKCIHDLYPYAISNYITIPALDVSRLESSTLTSYFATLQIGSIKASFQSDRCDSGPQLLDNADNVSVKWRPLTLRYSSCPESFPRAQNAPLGVDR